MLGLLWKVALVVKRVPVVSKSLLSVGYQNGVFEVEFRTNKYVYQHTGVPEHVYRGLLSALSKGGYYVDFIKGRYPCVRIP
jgi:hypothetical protein